MFVCVCVCVCMQLVSGTYARRETGRSVDIHTRPRSLTHTLVNLISFVLLASSCPLSHTPILSPFLYLSLSFFLSRCSLPASSLFIFPVSVSIFLSHSLSPFCLFTHSLSLVCFMCWHRMALRLSWNCPALWRLKLYSSSLSVLSF